MIPAMRALWLAMLIGCGGGSGFPGGPGTVTGAIHGATFAIADSVSGIVPITDIDGNVQHTAVIYMSTTPDACADLEANIAHPNQQRIVIGLSVVGTGTAFDAPTEPGTFTITTSTMSANWTAALLDQMCVATGLMARATAGTVDLTGVDGEAYGGRFDLTLDTAETVTGLFGSTACAAVATAFGETAHPAPSCQ
jgi:hypothetical protein